MAQIVAPGRASCPAGFNAKEAGELHQMDDGAAASGAADQAFVSYETDRLRKSRSGS